MRRREDAAADIRRASATRIRRALLLSCALLLAACAGHPQKKPPPPPGHAPAKASARKPWKPQGQYTPGGLYAPEVADGAPAELPDVANLPEPVPHPEPLSRYGNRSPYTVLGKTYTVLASAVGYDERGVASWYGTKFDGRMTSSLEPYDLARFSAAHRTLPLPSYARVTNLENGRSVIVRVNDRGPFREGRLIDLSYAAAIKLGVNVRGTAMVEVRGIDPGQPVLPAAATDATRSRPVAIKPTPPAPKPAAVPETAVAQTTASPPQPNAARDAVPVSSSSAASDATIPVGLAVTTPIAPPPAPAPVTTVPEHPAIDAATVGFLQIGSYADAGNANRMLARLTEAGIEHPEVVVVQVNGQSLWRVHVGPLRAEDAERIAEKLDALGFGHPPFFKN
jgi:rare lipoprotein A